MKNVLLAAAAAFALSTTANAAIIPVLDTVTPVGSEYQFSYSGTLAGDQGLVEGSTLVIFDFLGYVDGSISAGIYSSDVDAYTENTSFLLPPLGQDDDPLVANLVFRWIGSPFNASGGPFSDASFAGLTARSIYSGVRIDGFSAQAVLNNGAATGLAAFNSGEVGVPAALVPEPATWAMLIVGFGGVGVVMRARRRFALV